MKNNNGLTKQLTGRIDIPIQYHYRYFVSNTALPQSKEAQLSQRERASNNRSFCSNFGHFAFLSPLWGPYRDNVRRTMFILGSLESA